ncbi:MAG: 50S ribosomal protein L13 [Candidatus Komeilibacteria bacterium]
MIQREQKIIDASSKTAGRLASQIANWLIGKHKVTYQAHIDGGDLVKVINIGQLKFSGKKLEKKVYHRYTGYPGGIITTSMKEMNTKNPKKLLWKMVHDMLPKNRLRSRRIKRLTFGK